MDVSRETEERLRAYAALIRKWTGHINLIAASTLDNLWDRHILDSAQLFDLVNPDAARWGDLGTGAGLPGIVVAILAQEKLSALHVTLVESDARKATFCRTVVRELGLSATVVADRVEIIPTLQADVVSARALAPLPRLVAYAHRHLVPGGTALFLKGARHMAEVEVALASWSFSVEKIPSDTDPRGVILRIGDIERA